MTGRIAVLIKLTNKHIILHLSARSDVQLGSLITIRLYIIKISL